MQIEHHIGGFVLFLTDIINKSSGLFNALSARNEKVPGIVEFGPTIYGTLFKGNPHQLTYRIIYGIDA